MARNIGNQLSTGIVAAVLSGGMISYCFSEPNKVESELRERCGKRTEEIWKKKFGIDDISNTKDAQIISKYENHYNATLDKCFYLTRSDIIGKKKVTKVERLFDVENKEYGRFTGGNGDTFHTLCSLGRARISAVQKMNGVCLSSNTWKTLIDWVVVDGVLVGLKSNIVQVASVVLMIGAGLQDT